MLFALDWIDQLRDGLFSALVSLIEALNFEGLSYMLTSHTLVTLISLIMGAVLCFAGFRYHKLVHAFMGAALLGSFGWFLGMAANSETVVIAAVYTTMMMIIGFFFIYVCYFLNVYGMAFVFLVALGAPFRGAFYGMSIWFACILAFAISAIYSKYKLVMSAIFGGCMLGLTFYKASPASAIIITGGCIAMGIVVQLKLQKRYELRKQQALEEEVKKYPYGPGIAYGWEDPTLKHLKH